MDTGLSPACRRRRQHGRTLALASGIMALIHLFLPTVSAAAAGTIPPVATGVERAAPVPAVMTLDHDWTLVNGATCTDPGTVIATPAYAPAGGVDGWQPAEVPGTVLDSLVHIGRFPDPYHDLVNRLQRDAQGRLTVGAIPDASVPGGPFSGPWWYRDRFNMPPSVPGRTVWLEIGGINWQADVFLDGHQVGTVTGAFTRGIFDVTAWIVPGVNVLAISIHPPPVPGLPAAHGCGGDTTHGSSIGLTPDTIYQTVGWDFTFPDGVRDRDMGLIAPVHLRTTGAVAIRDPMVWTDGTASPDHADEDVRAFLVNATAVPQQGTFSAAFAGATASTAITLKPHERREVVLTHQEYGALVIHHPRLWWPVGHGEATLHPLHTVFTLADGTVSDERTTSCGIRSVVRTTAYGGENVFIVNGHRMFMAGGAWVKDAMLRATPGRLDAEIRMVAQAGLDWLRCWSGSGPESDDFFSACDRHGVLVWVESGLTGQTDIPADQPTYLKTILGNWKDTVLRLRSHPSVFCYCGSNESDDVPGMAGIAQRWDGSRPYLPDSMDGGQRGGPYRYQGIDCLYDLTGTDIYGGGQRGIFAGFCNECGNPCLPTYTALRAQIPLSELWPIDPAAIAYHDGGGFHRILDFISQGCATYGDFAIPDPAGRTGAANYAFKGQILGAMEYRADGELWQRHKWDASPRHATGWALWTVDNTHPETCSRLFDYSLEPNASLYAMAHANKPLHAQFDYAHDDVSVVDDGISPASGLTVRAEIRNLDWSLRWSGQATVAAIGEDTTLNGLISIPVKEFPGFDPVHFIDVSLTDAGGAIIDRQLYWRSRDDDGVGADGPFSALACLPPQQISVTTTSGPSTPGRRTIHCTISNPGRNLAFFIRLDLVDADGGRHLLPAFYSSNDISLRPGESMGITIDCSSELCAGLTPAVAVEGWNIAGLTVPVPGAATTPVLPALPGLDPEDDAFNRPTACSSSAPHHGSEAAVDGDPATGWTPVGSGSQWIAVDLGSVHAIQGATLRWQGPPPASYRLQACADGRTWIDAAAGPPPPAAQVHRDVLAFPLIDARFVRLVCTPAASGVPTLLSWRVHGPRPLPPLPDLARLSPASASSQTAPHEASWACDGDDDTFWESLAGPDPQWLAVDLGAMKLVSQVRIVWGAGYAERYRIEVSPDGAVWSPVATEDRGQGHIEVVRFPAVTTRHVRLVGLLRARHWLGYEVMAFEVRGPDRPGH